MLFVFEGRTLTIPRLPSGGFEVVKSGVWSRLHIKNPPTAVWGDLRGCIAGFGSACEELKVEPFRTSGGGAEDGKSSQICKPRGPLRGEELKGKGYGAGSQRPTGSGFGSSEF